MTGSVRTFERGIALIVEGATEKMFYQVYLERCCDACPPAHMDKELLDGDVCFVIRGCSHGERLVMFHSMDTITQMPNAGAWFNRACKGKFPAVPWSVFLCYDADEYNHPVSKFREGDWARLREEIEEGAENVFDLAAEADIEDGYGAWPAQGFRVREGPGLGSRNGHPLSAGRRPRDRQHPGLHTHSAQRLPSAQASSRVTERI